MKTERYDVFLSYCHEDSSLARDIEQKLIRGGVTCFMAEKQLRPTEDWLSELRDAIAGCRCALLLITPRSRHNRWLLMETGAAWVLGKKCLAAIQFVKADKLPEPVRRFQCAVIETPAQINKLIRDVANMIGPDRLTGKRRVSFDEFLHLTARAQMHMIRDAWRPNLVVGSGRGGAICGGVIAAQLGYLPIKLVDLQFSSGRAKGHTHIDMTALTPDDIRGKSVLLVESTRQTAKSAKLIMEKLRSYGAASVRSFALVCLRSCPMKPEYSGLQLESVPTLPWFVFPRLLDRDGQQMANRS